MTKKISPTLAAFIGIAACAVVYLFVPPPKPAAAAFGGQATFAGVSAGSANAQTINVPNLTANTPGVQIWFIPGTGLTNSGPTQINVSGIGLTSVFRPSSIGLVAFSGQEFLAGEQTCITYNPLAAGYQLCANVDMTPIGKMEPLRGSTTARGRLIEDGSCVSQTTYAALFSVIGTLYGTCSAGLFALPDSRGSLFAALDTQGVNGAANRLTSAGSGCTATSVAFRCGAQNQTLTVPQLPVFTPSTSSFGFGSSTNSGGAQANSGSGSAAYLPIGDFGATTFNSIGGGNAHPIVPPVLGGISAIKY